MAILVAAGAMSLPWVLGIAGIVFAEKLLPRGEWTARVVGVLLVVAGVAVALRPELALALRGQLAGAAGPMPM
jgi:predicted metal-binding membrane protein